MLPLFMQANYLLDRYFAIGLYFLNLVNQDGAYEEEKGNLPFEHS